MTEETRADALRRLREGGCVYAEDEVEVLLAAARTPAQLAALVDRRVAGEPLEQVVGWAEFCGVRLRVAPGVFVPRRRSELVVTEAVRRARPGAVVLELCCGSAAISAAIAARCAGLQLHAVDIDPRAVDCARSNLAGWSAAVYEGDLDAPLPASLRGRVDLVVANAPYVPTGELPLLPREAREHEPARALDGGVDGLALQRRIAALAPSWLAPAGVVVVETSARQAGLSEQLLGRVGLATHVVRDAALGATVVVGVS